MTFTRTYTVAEPAIGRQVHYVQRGSADGAYKPRCATALVVDTGTGPDGNSAGGTALHVNVIVSASKGGTFPELGVAHELPSEAQPPAPGTWHWWTECPDAPASALAR